MIDRLKILISAWKKEAEFLSGPHDLSEDRAVGAVYAACAEQLEDILETFYDKLKAL